MEQLASLKKDVAEVKGERQASKILRDMDGEYTRVKQELTDLQITFDKEKERHEREKRETEHFVGLERKRSEFEAKKAASEATLAVREENLKADRERFEGQLKFHEDRFTQEVGYLKEMVEQMLERLPKVELRSNSTQATTKNGDDDKE